MRVGCTSLVRGSIGITLDGLLAVLCKILVLVMGFTLPVVNRIGSKDVESLLPNFYLGTIADELVHGSPFADIILES